MFEQFLKMPHIIKRLQKSKFKWILDKCAEYLVSRRYSAGSIRHYRLALEHFLYWLEAQKKLSVKKVNIFTINQFINKHIPICKCSTPAARRIEDIRPAFRLLLKIQQTSDKSVNYSKPLSKTDQLLNEFYNYLSNVKGLAEKTCKYHVKNAKIFLNKIFSKNHVNFAKLTPTKIRNFLYNNFLYYKRRTFGLFVYSIRSFVKYLQFKGILKNSLIEAFPRIIEYKSTSLPEALNKMQTKIFLNSFNRSTAIGKRDYSIVVCMLELGLRASEVTNLTLDKINWREQTIYLSLDKTREDRILPMTKQFQESLIDYLRYGRPQTYSRQIFVYHRAPVGQGIGSRVISCLVGRAIVRSGLQIKDQGSNLLRRTFATKLLQKGASIKEIADLLGHNSINTTTIYTKVDFRKLTKVALPWLKEAI